MPELPLNLEGCGLQVDNGPVIVALSGGADSVALLRAMMACGFSVVAAHCAYGLRGAESEGDCRFVQQLCASLGVALEVLRPDVRARMERCGVSLEMACRDLRYEWFATLKERHGAQAVAVAHHREDNVETCLLNLQRTTGLHGLRGMALRRAPGIVRPLLDVTRRDIEAYLRALGQPWREDSSNGVADVKRNKLRLQVLPVLEQALPGATARISASMTRISQQAALYDSLLARERGRYAHPSIPGAICVERLACQEPHAALMLYEWLKADGLTRAMADDIISAPGRRGLRFGPFTLHGGVLAPLAPEPESVCITDLLLAPQFRASIITPGEFKPRRDPSVAYFAADILEGSPAWELRPRRDGDRYAPFGMKGATRLVSDLFTDRHLSPNEKGAARVLTRNGLIVWLPALACCHHFPVTPATAKILRLEYLSP